MAVILPRDLPPIPGGIVDPGSAIIVDNGAGVWKATPAEAFASALRIATSAEAISGASVFAFMNPALVQEAIDAMAVTQADLANPTGAAMVGVIGGGTVQDALDSLNTFTIGASVTPPLADDEYLFAYTFAYDVTFPADFAGSVGAAIDAATVPTTYEIMKVASGDPVSSAVGVGTVEYSTSFTFATAAGAPVLFETGDMMIFKAPSIADSTATCAITFIGAK